MFRDLLTHMMEDPRNITFCTHLLFCSKNLERVGDHTTNIAETVYYIVTGQSLPTERPRGFDFSACRESTRAMTETRTNGGAAASREPRAAHPCGRGRSRARAAAGL